jgi:hypothetical protein
MPVMIRPDSLRKCLLNLLSHSSNHLLMGTLTHRRAPLHRNVGADQRTRPRLLESQVKRATRANGSLPYGLSCLHRRERQRHNLLGRRLASGFEVREVKADRVADMLECLIERVTFRNASL